MKLSNVKITVYQPGVAVPGFVQRQEALQAELIAAHRRGEHPYGEMRRECPLCQGAG